MHPSLCLNGTWTFGYIELVHFKANKSEKHGTSTWPSWNVFACSHIFRWQCSTIFQRSLVWPLTLWRIPNLQANPSCSTVWGQHASPPRQSHVFSMGFARKSHRRMQYQILPNMLQFGSFWVTPLFDSENLALPCMVHVWTFKKIGLTPYSLAQDLFHQRYPQLLWVTMQLQPPQCLQPLEPNLHDAIEPLNASSWSTPGR